MKFLLAAINAKYIHSNLAVYSLKAYAQSCCARIGKDRELEIAEYTINQPAEGILADLYDREPDVLCLSCYIWNLVYVEQIVGEMKKVCPKTDIWLGGPGVSYDAREVLLRLPEVTGVMKGEGEQTFAELLDGYPQYSHIEGITFRGPEGAISDNGWRPVMELSQVPFVYENMEGFEHKIIYYETSRGCPFSCSYCLSSIDKTLRFRKLDLVEKELGFFLDKQVPQVKLVDRTFNANHAHAMAVWKYLAEHDNGVTNFHFEVAADLLNEEELALMRTMRPGLIQLEIGVQSTNLDTIREIRRTMQFDKVKAVVSNIHERGNIHQHLDLIAGLPYEDIASFARSFDQVYALHPEQLQLGFLKVLKGSFMAEKSEDYGLVHQSTPPYEVLYTRWLSYGDVLRLKGVEQMVEVYYNSGQFTHTMKALECEFPSPYGMYDRLRAYYEERGLLSVQHKSSARYEILLDFIGGELPDRKEYYREWLIFDYYLRENAKTRPEFAGRDKVTKETSRDFYEQEERQRHFLKGYEHCDKSQMRKMTHLERFPLLGKTVIFDYLRRNPLNREARTCIVKIT